MVQKEKRCDYFSLDVGLKIPFCIFFVVGKPGKIGSNIQHRLPWTLLWNPALLELTKIMSKYTSPCLLGC